MQFNTVSYFVERSIQTQQASDTVEGTFWTDFTRFRPFAAGFLVVETHFVLQPGLILKIF